MQRTLCQQFSNTVVPALRCFQLIPVIRSGMYVNRAQNVFYKHLELNLFAEYVQSLFILTKPRDKYLHFICLISVFLRM